MKKVIKDTLFLLGWLIFFLEVYKHFQTKTPYGIIGIWGIITLIITCKQLISIKKVKQKYDVKHQEVQAQESSQGILSLETISETQFKELVMYVFYKQGYNIILTKKENKILLEMGALIINVTLCYSQEKVKEKIIRNLLIREDIEENKERIFISNQMFSEQARYYAIKNNITLIGCEEIERILRKVEIKTLKCLQRV